MYILDEFYYEPTWDSWTFAGEYFKKIKETLKGLGIEAQYKDNGRTRINMQNSSDIANAGLPSWSFYSGQEYFNSYNNGDNGYIACRALWWTVDDCNYMLFTNPEYFGMTLQVVPVNKNIDKYKAFSTRYGFLNTKDKIYRYTIVKNDDSFFIQLHGYDDNIYISGGHTKTFNSENKDILNLLSFDINNKPDVSGLGATIKTSMLAATKSMYSSELGDRFLNKTPIADLHLGFASYGYYGIAKGIYDTTNSMYKQGEIINIGGENFLYIPQWKKAGSIQDSNSTAKEKWWLLKC